ncbi:hypothetical protein D6792_02865, partial [Candidatus Parcubacteria bacterium]
MSYLQRFTATIAAGALLTANLAGGFLFFTPTPASAKTILTVEIPGPLLAAQTVQAAVETTLTIKETALDGVAFTIINAAIIAIVRNIILLAINEIQGISGQAAFVTDLKGLMQTLADRG